AEEERDTAIILLLVVLVIAEVTRKMEPQEPRTARSRTLLVGLSVSPVGVKKKVRNSEFGNQAIFSGRLNGVAPADLARAVAEPSLIALFFGGVAIVTHLIG